MPLKGGWGNKNTASLEAFKGPLRDKNFYLNKNVSFYYSEKY